MTSDFNFQKAREAWGDKVVAPTHRVFQEWLHNPLTKALKESHKNEIEKLEEDYEKSTGMNDFKPDWDTVKAFDDRYTEDTDLLRKCLDALEYESQRGNDDAYRELRDELKERLK